MVCWQTVIGSQNKRFGIADHNMQPMEHTAVWVVVLMLVGVVPHTRFAGQKNNLYNGKG